jgi:pimeloyl-ACP methyl ester carboxylesterase
MKTNYFLGVSADGFHRNAYTEWGQPDPNRPTVICVHGLLRNRHDFNALANYLDHQGRHVLCPDIVGRGDSDWFKNPKHYTFEQYINDMSVLISKSSCSQIDWIGTSMGGLIGMMMAALPNTPIRRLILNDVGAQIPIHGLRRLSKYAQTPHQFNNKDEATQYYKTIYADFGQLTESEWTEFSDNSIRLESSGLYTPKCDPDITNNKTHSQFIWDFMHHPHKTFEGVFFDVDLWSIWEHVKCPVLIVHGEHSDILLPEYITKMKKVHPKTDVMEIADAGHAPALLKVGEHEQINLWLNHTHDG